MKKLNLVMVGDSVITMRQSVHSEHKFLKMIELIKSADLAFTNLEVVLCDYEGYPAESSGGTYMRADPSIVDEVLWMGFDVVSIAHNHSLDYMYDGLFKTIEHLDAAGIPHSGTGGNLAEARKPTYMELPQGRIALITATSSFAPFGRAGSARKDMQGRPGINPLRYEKYYVVREETIQALKNIEKELMLTEVYQPEEVFYFLRNKFVVGNDFGGHTRVHKGDMEGNLDSVREAVRQADWVFFSHHAHEGREESSNKPAEFTEEFARICIDTGAHGFLGHGHHGLRGIEIRDYRPIIYGLGAFIFQNETITKMPSDIYERYNLDPNSGNPADLFDARYDALPRPGYPIRKWFTEEEKGWLSAITSMTFENNRLTEMKIYPIELGQNKARSQRGRPMMTETKMAERILEMIQDLSEPYDTKIIIKDGVGIVKL